MEQLQNRAGGSGGFGSAARAVEKNGDHFPVAKSRPPGSVVIKIGPGKWAPFFLGARSKFGSEELRNPENGHHFLGTFGSEFGFAELLYPKKKARHFCVGSSPECALEELLYAS